MIKIWMDVSDEWVESRLNEGKDQSGIMNGGSKMGLAIAVCLVEFLVDRGIVGLVSGKSSSAAVGESFVLKRQTYIEVGVESFPLSSNLPMVCVPVGWGRQDERQVGSQSVPVSQGPTIRKPDQVQGHFFLMTREQEPQDEQELGDKDKDADGRGKVFTVISRYGSFQVVNIENY